MGWTHKVEILDGVAKLFEWYRQSLEYTFWFMTQDERWMEKYKTVVGFIESTHRNPSRHRIEEHDMQNWLKATRKRMNAGELKLERVELFQKLLELMEQHRRVNQWK